MISYPIYTEKTECQDCYKCVRHCPVKAIRVEEFHATIDHELCVFCGKCVEICPVQAKRVRNDIPRAKLLLQRKKQVFVSLAPSYPVEFPGEERLILGALKRLGFAGVAFTARGAAALSREIRQDRRELTGRISSACPVVVEYVRKYQPLLTPHLSSYLSPMLIHGGELRRLGGEDIGVVFIGPCIAKKREADSPGSTVDIALTFREFRRWIEEEGIGWEDLLQEALPEEFSLGGAELYPMEGGMARTLEPGDEGMNILGCAGLKIIKESLDSALLAGEEAPFLDLLGCEGGCLNGPGMSVPGDLLRKQGVLLRSWDEQKRRGEKTLPELIDLKGLTVPVSPEVHPEAAPEPEIRKVLKGLGKKGAGDELNCGGCGYYSCRDFAAACVRGMAEPAMCVTSMRQIAQKKADALLHTIPLGIVIVDSRLKIRECNAPFIRQFTEIDIEVDQRVLMGLTGTRIDKILPWEGYFQAILESPARLEERQLHHGGRIFSATFFAIEREHMAGAVFQDITSPAMKRETVVKKAEEVIRKSLSSVQQIASLLGENAAETEIILTSLIEAFEPSGEEDQR